MAQWSVMLPGEKCAGRGPVYTEGLLLETCYQFQREAAGLDMHEKFDHFVKLYNSVVLFLNLV